MSVELLMWLMADDCWSLEEGERETRRMSAGLAVLRCHAS